MWPPDACALTSERVTGLDWVIVAFTALLAFYGYLQGFIVGALSLAGFVLGALIGTRVAPLVLSQGARSPYAPLFGLLGALLAGGVFASGLEGVGARARSRLSFASLRFQVLAPGTRSLHSRTWTRRFRRSTRPRANSRRHLPTRAATGWLRWRT